MGCVLFKTPPMLEEFSVAPSSQSHTTNTLTDNLAQKHSLKDCDEETTIQSSHKNTRYKEATWNGHAQCPTDEQIVK